jgi:hypothetical protein
MECMYGYTNTNWSHRYSNKGFKEKFRSHTIKIFNTFVTKSRNWNDTRSTESTAV